jgi:hypothetical protein
MNNLFYMTTAQDRKGRMMSKKVYEKKYDKGILNVYAAKKSRFEENLLRAKSGGGYSHMG